MRTRKRVGRREGDREGGKEERNGRERDRDSEINHEGLTDKIKVTERQSNVCPQ